MSLNLHLSIDPTCNPSPASVRSGCHTEWQQMKSQLGFCKVLLPPTQAPVTRFPTSCASDLQDADNTPLLYSVLPDAGVLTWGRVTQYRFLTLTSEPTLTDLHTVLRTMTARPSRSSGNALANTTDQDMAGLSTPDPALLLQGCLSRSHAFQATAARK